MALYSQAEIRKIEQVALELLPVGTLMQRAGQAAANLALSLLKPLTDKTRVLILAGPGNNGGDALEVATILRRAGLEIVVLLFANPSQQPADARQAYERAKNSGARFADPLQADQYLTQHWNLIVDGLFGIGLTRAISGVLHDVIAQLNRQNHRVLALDVPSGLHADTGNVVGTDGIAVCATHTISFIGDKPGLHTGDGRDYAGLVSIASLDIDAALFPAATAHLNDVSLFAHVLRRRPHNSHKGSFGDVAIIGGANGMAGATILAARAAAMSGAGRTFAAFIDSPPAYDSNHPELMCRLAQDMDLSTAACVIGPGLGRSQHASELVAKGLQSTAPLVLDADALNLIAADSVLQEQLARRAHHQILTPHPLEAARLLATSTAAVQADRLQSARQLAVRFASIVVLKGSGTIIAHPDGQVVINSTGNPALATAGSGDVLAGMCGALLAQGWSAWDAALAAVWLHGHAADCLVAEGIGPIGLTAGELIPEVRRIINHLVNKQMSASGTHS